MLNKSSAACPGEDSWADSRSAPAIQGNWWRRTPALVLNALGWALRQVRQWQCSIGVSSRSAS